MTITDEQVERAVAQAYQDEATELHGSWTPPASAHVRDYAGDWDALKQADNDAHQVNLAAMRRILEAAFREVA